MRVTLTTFPKDMLLTSVTNPRWVVSNPGGKDPKNPRTGEDARAGVESTFGFFEEINGAIKNGIGEFPGLEFIYGDNLCCIDIDCHSRTPAEAMELYRTIREKMGSSGDGEKDYCYAETTKSGGIHLVFSTKKDWPRVNRKSRKRDIEIWNDGKYVRLTTDSFVNPTSLLPVDISFYNWFMAEFFPEKQEPQPTPTEKRTPEKLSLSASDVIQIAGRSRNGEMFNRLMEGDTSAHDGDDSAADLALCNMLAFYTGKDAGLMDEIFRSSGLMRDKWDTKRGATTYGAQTIQRAIRDTKDVYEGNGGGSGFQAPASPAEPAVAKGEKTISAKKFKPTLDMASLENFLKDNGISVRQNVISHDIQISGVAVEYNPESTSNDLPIILHDQLKKRFSCNKDLIADLLGVIAGKNRYNPVADLLSGLKWDGTSRINHLCKILGISDPLSKTLLTKWLCQCVSMAYNNPKDPYGADGILVLQGEGGIGKTYFVSKLCMGKRELYKLGQHLDAYDKDTERRSSSAWIVEWGELETTLRSDLERLKAFITADRDEYRLPYARTDQKVVRRTSIIASCNPGKFLIDPTGNRRFWTIPLTTIDLDAMNNFEFPQLWAEIYQWVSADHWQYFRLTGEERVALAERNAEHEKPLKGQCEVEDILSEARDNAWYDWKYITVSDFKAEHESLRSFSAEQIGRTLDKLGIMQERKAIDGKRQRCRRLPARRYPAVASN